jgi:hypothetical protein
MIISNKNQQTHHYILLKRAVYSFSTLDSKKESCLVSKDYLKAKELV